MCTQLKYTASPGAAANLPMAAAAVKELYLGVSARHIRQWLTCRTAAVYIRCGFYSSRCRIHIVAYTLFSAMDE